MEAARDFKRALVVYESAQAEGLDLALLHTALARCYFQLRDFGPAIDHARRAIEVDPHAVEPHLLEIEACIRSGRRGSALVQADRLIAIAPNDESAHYARGRALLALGRLDEARGGFERAIVLRPRMMEAMLMRREVDRQLRVIHKTVGEQPPLALDIPDHLRELRAALAQGVDNAIAFLERPQYSADPIAQLLLGRCLAFVQRLDEAAAVFERVVDGFPDHRRVAMIDRAHALLELGYSDEGLRLLELVQQQAPEQIAGYPTNDKTGWEE